MIENSKVSFYDVHFFPGVTIDGKIDFPSTADGTAYLNYRLSDGMEVEIDTVQLWNSSRYAG